MKWDDTGFLVSKNKYNENSLISEIYTRNHGKVTGLVFGGTSKKIKNYLQIGNQLHVNYNSKSENRLGYFKLEIQNAFSPIYFEHREKINCICSVMNLVRLLTAEYQSNINIFSLIEKFYYIISKDEWLKNYIFWELELLKVLGFDLELNSLVTKELIDNKTIYVVKSKNEKKIVPNFLIDKNLHVDDLNTLLKGLKLVSDFLEKNILQPNNLNYPISRTHFIDSIKL
ncbi:DNA repair protein RecO [Candidatus Pelagibacter sp.]|nr:DNA repair protein RecO [Candidatus Pelagibacter sp.]